METLLHADIFFFVTTIAVIFATAGFLVIIVYAVRILHDIKHFSRRIREEGEVIMRDIEILRKTVKESGGALRHLLWFLPGTPQKRTARARAGKGRKSTHKKKDN